MKSQLLEREKYEERNDPEEKNHLLIFSLTIAFTDQTTDLTRFMKNFSSEDKLSHWERAQKIQRDTEVVRSTVRFHISGSSIM